MKTVQPTIKKGRKWKVVEAVNEAKEILKIKELIGKTHRKGLESSTAKWWSKAEGKEKETWSSMRNGSIKSPEGFRKQSSNHTGQWTNWDNALQKFLTRNEIWHMAPLRTNFLIRSVYDLLPSNANLVRWGKKEDPTCPLRQGRQTTEHVLSSGAIHMKA